MAGTCQEYSFSFLPVAKGMVIELDAKMKIVYGWYSAENEESSEISK